MIETLKKLYSLIPQEELIKEIPKISNISESGIENSTKILYISNEQGESYLKLLQKNKTIETKEYKSSIYPDTCEILVFHKDINGIYSFNKKLIEEILNN
jgi:hypothetical protein